jgi:prefoldin subunit 5
MATMTSELTIEILKQIRDGITSMREDFNQRLDQTNQRLDQTNQRLDQTIQRLDRVEQGLTDLGQFMRQIALDQARHERFHVHHVDILEKDVADLKERMRRVEDRIGT